MANLVDFDREIMEGKDRIAGLDEAGRGALAGPVMVGCVSARPEVLAEDIYAEVNDSKQLARPRREALFRELASDSGIDIGLGAADNGEIDELGINEAAGLAASRALGSLSLNLDLVLLDKGLALDYGGRTVSLEKGDERSFHVAAASIMAKVTRDRYMMVKARHFTGYEWETNVGYGTGDHKESIERNGPTPLHRKSYKLT